MIEVSFGVIPIRPNGDILIIQDGHGNWGFPKGHPDKNEDVPKETAKRELFEETGLKVVDWVEPKHPLISTYFNPITRQKKQVEYFPAHVSGNVVIQESEIRSFMWIPKEGLDLMLKFKELKELLPWIPTLPA